MSCSSDEPAFIIMINKNFHLISRFHVFRNISGRKKYFFPIAPIQVNPEIQVFYYFKCVVFSYF